MFLIYTQAPACCCVAVMGVKSWTCPVSCLSISCFLNLVRLLLIKTNSQDKYQLLFAGASLLQKVVFGDMMMVVISWKLGVGERECWWWLGRKETVLLLRKALIRDLLLSSSPCLEIYFISFFTFSSSTSSCECCRVFYISGPCVK